jgi:hypothetical protein
LSPIELNWAIGELRPEAAGFCAESPRFWTEAGMQRFEHGKF